MAQQYTRKGGDCRTETVVNTPTTSHRQTGFATVADLKPSASPQSTLLRVQRLSHDCPLGVQTSSNCIALPWSTSRASRRSLRRPSIQAVLAALLVFRLLPMGFANRELRAHVAPLLGVSADAYGSTRATYDLRRLRLRGLVERIPRSHRYRVTEAGQRVALCYSRGQRRVLGPTLSAVFDDVTPPALGRLVKRFDDHINRLWQGQPLAA